MTGQVVLTCNLTHQAVDKIWHNFHHIVAISLKTFKDRPRHFMARHRNLISSIQAGARRAERESMRSEGMDLSLDSVSIHLFLRLFIGCILLSSGIGKLLHPMRFQRAILDYRIIPSHGWYKDVLPGMSAFGLSLTETGTGLGLLSGFLLRLSIVLALCLFLLFSGALIINLVRGRKDLSCHCDGMMGDHRISWWMVGRNILFIMVLLILAVLPIDMFTLETLLQNPSQLSISMWMNIALPVILVVLGVLIVLMIVNALRVALIAD